jgi:protein-tyrosine phosphatase
MAEALLADGLARRGVDATVSSAGLLDDGRPADPHSVAVMGDRQLDLSGHASRRMTAELLEAADLIVGMERRHVREAAVAVPEVWPRSFTLRELARRAVAAGPRPADVSLDTWLAELSADRTTADHLGDFTGDDVPDPIGRGVRSFRRCADDLEQLVGVVLDHLWPTEPAAAVPSPDALRSTTA